MAENENESPETSAEPAAVERPARGGSARSGGGGGGRGGRGGGGRGGPGGGRGRGGPQGQGGGGGGRGGEGQGGGGGGRRLEGKGRHRDQSCREGREGRTPLLLQRSCRRRRWSGSRGICHWQGQRSLGSRSQGR